MARTGHSRQSRRRAGAPARSAGCAACRTGCGTAAARSWPPGWVPRAADLTGHCRTRAPVCVRPAGGAGCKAARAASSGHGPPKNGRGYLVKQRDGLAESAPQPLQENLTPDRRLPVVHGRGCAMKRYLDAVCAAVLFGALAGGTAAAQQAHVNLDWNPHKNAQNLKPYGANVISPEVPDDRTVTFRLKAPDARTVALLGRARLLLASGRATRRFRSEGGRRRLDADRRSAEAEPLHLPAACRRRRRWSIRTTRSPVSPISRATAARRPRRRPGVLRREARARTAP